MADFLTRLVGRTLGVAPTVQPMIAPLYAPDSALLAGQASLPVFGEEISGEPGQPSLWSAEREGMNLPMYESLQASTAVEGQERGAHTFADPLPFSLRQDTVFPSVGEAWAGAAQPALPALVVNSTVNSQHTLSSLLVAGEGVQPGAHGAHIPLSPMFMNGEGGVPGAETPRSSRFITGAGDQSGGVQARALSSPAAPLPVPDEISPLHTREVQALPAEAQRQAGSASFMVQKYQESDVPHTVLDVHSVERQRAAGNLPQAALSTDSRSRASMRRTATDAMTGRHELSPEGAAPSTSAAPTIQVTIGRIEVRATQPPPAQRSMPRPGPRMVSLEEYLNQQAKGGQ